MSFGAGNMKGGAGLELEKLVKDYQGGNNSTLEAIAALLWPREGRTVIRLICGQAAPGYLPGADNVPVTIEPFNFNDNDLQRVFNNSLDYALKTYISGKGKKFSSWFYDVFRGRLYNLKGEYMKQQADGENLRTFEAYQERARDMLGSPFDADIIKHETFFSDELLKGMNDQEKKYCALLLNCIAQNINITNEIAGQILGVSKRQVTRYRENLKSKLDNLPNIKNEYGIKDPTPRQAAINIYTNC